MAVPVMTVDVKCPFLGCGEPIVVNAKPSPPVLDTPSYVAMVNIGFTDVTVRDAAWAHLEEHHPDLIDHMGPTADPVVSPDAARWRPEDADEVAG